MSSPQNMPIPPSADARATDSSTASGPGTSTADVPGTGTSDAHVETVGAFDIRVFIGALIGLFGVILTLMGLLAYNAAQAELTGGINANLWAGLVMAAVGIAFFAWAKLEPIRIVVQDNAPGAEEPKDIAPID